MQFILKVLLFILLLFFTFIVGALTDKLADIIYQFIMKKRNNKLK